MSLFPYKSDTQRDRLIAALRQSRLDGLLGVDREYLHRQTGIPLAELQPWIDTLRAEGVLGGQPFQFRRHHGEFFHRVVKLPPIEGDAL